MFTIAYTHMATTTTTAVTSEILGDFTIKNICVQYDISCWIALMKLIYSFIMIVDLTILRSVSFANIVIGS